MNQLESDGLFACNSTLCLWTEQNICFPFCLSFRCCCCSSFLFGLITFFSNLASHGPISSSNPISLRPLEVPMQVNSSRSSVSVLDSCGIKQRRKEKKGKKRIHQLHGLQLSVKTKEQMKERSKRTLLEMNFLRSLFLVGRSFLTVPDPMTGFV